MHSGEQNVARPELRFNARSAGIHVPHLSQRTNLFFEGDFCRVALGALMSVATSRQLITFSMSWREGRKRAETRTKMMLRGPGMIRYFDMITGFYMIYM